ncbi:MAG: ABC transporter ATP-binding protein [Candidatus Aquicultor secundus]|uniref:ABC transporter ATP-binding protein n=1 Tax=Candidatus Aquicultor secundus TaxID=1973895 RepID=A0A2M7TAN5_9ACTN|nr:ABC transporter ATP-binding protein [Candidatus Aquicultor secundus]NCO66471.1 ABC transporter ATP-binding protein [Solirubrobacter sp.]OIO88466.1 MAG: hypothetical protein AUK32_01510 [Candidatus Aquicultor secundus]PIU26913.1 MAG: ABC transporter ATP-binding protein [Candidatus Aquicultor secundus]PIW22846.1 MAG: ABC transporter ATP-binding protein [Candidatus Aquicultor secundus]PIX52947.1 MAG: ABC transporter ATP-binding protein [Candidatus Aquicultor secundus]
MAPYLVIKDLVMHYGTTTVLDIKELTVNQGEVLAVIGPNGSGKSTLLRLIAHLEKRSNGSIEFVAGEKPEGELDIRRRLAFVFQESLLFSGTVFDNIAYGLKVRKTGRSEIEQKVLAIAETLGIAHLLTRSAQSLSGGEAQRSSLARALVLEPELLLLDEPMASLDPPTRESFLVDLYEILEKLNTTVIYVTHELTEAMILADRCAFIDAGVIQQIGSPREVTASPATRGIADFVGVRNILKGRTVARANGLVRIKVNGAEVEAIGPDNPSDKVWVLIRPENVTITLAKTGTGSGVRNHFSGTVTTILDLGVFYRAILDCGFPLVAFITKRSVEDMGLTVGQKVWASFKATGVHIISREGEHG